MSLVYVEVGHAKTSHYYIASGTKYTVNLNKCRKCAYFISSLMEKSHSPCEVSRDVRIIIRRLVLRLITAMTLPSKSPAGDQHSDLFSAVSEV